MATITVTNIDTEPVLIQDLYVTIPVGGAVQTTRSVGDLDKMASLRAAIAANKATVSVVYSAAELSLLASLGWIRSELLVDFEDIGADPIIIGRVQRSGAQLLFKRDGGPPIDLAAGIGGDTKETSLMYGRDSAVVTGGSYLHASDGVSSSPGNSAPVFPFGSTTIIAASVGIDGAPGGTWEVNIQVNGVTQATLTGGSGVDQIIDTALSITISAGDRINVRMDPGSVNVARPVVVLLLQR